MSLLSGISISGKAVKCNSSLQLYNIPCIHVRFNNSSVKTQCCMFNDDAHLYHLMVVQVCVELCGENSCEGPNTAECRLC